VRHVGKAGSDDRFEDMKISLIAIPLGKGQRFHDDELARGFPDLPKFFMSRAGAGGGTGCCFRHDPGEGELKINFSRIMVRKPSTYPPEPAGGSSRIYRKLTCAEMPKFNFCLDLWLSIAEAAGNLVQVASAADARICARGDLRAAGLWMPLREACRSFFGDCMNFSWRWPSCARASFVVADHGGVCAKKTRNSACCAPFANERVS